ncbi:MAG: hemolysin III family protein [Clostridia bacterium]|nr:hemolysin III family protein [Clostridia bacterium]
MKRTALRQRILPTYTRAEEIMNMVTHIVGGAFGIVALVSCVLLSAFTGNVWGVVSSAIYGGSMVVLYTMSSIYHGLKREMPKKVMQVIDHCTIYLLIAGTYTPILFCSIRKISPVMCWVIFGIVWGCAALAATLTAIDLKKYKVFSMICYIAMGWCILIDIDTCYKAMGQIGFWFLLSGGIFYTVGAVMYGIGKKKKFMHSVFHIFTVLGSILQYISIIGFVL